jgi:arabinose-5-phosphate isomerase
MLPLRSAFGFREDRIEFMSSLAARTIIPFSQLEQLREGRAIIEREAVALNRLAASLDGAFCDAVGLLAACQGKIVVTGMGKAGLIGQKIAATLASTGSSAVFLHPAEAVHGDLGSLQQCDAVLALSNSGETDEVCRLLPSMRRLGVPLIAITASETSSLGSSADVVLKLGRLTEADANGLAPSTSTTAMLATGDALALVISQLKGFTAEHFAALHPAGSLGRKLMLVRDAMRSGGDLRIANEHSSVRELLVELRTHGRRTGAVMLVDEEDCLRGLFTDSDLARLLEGRRDGQLDRPVSEVMTADPLTVAPDVKLQQAVDLLSAHKLSELPVVDAGGHPIGLIDITDLIGIMPAESET